MEKDEDMFIVIVGDENTDNSPALIQNKQETLDENEVEQVIDCIKNSEDVQHLQALDKPFVKEEILGTEDSNEYLSEISSSFELNENMNFNHEDDDGDGDKYFPDFIEAPVNGLSVTMSNDISSEESETKNARRTKLLKPSQRYSYVKELRNQFPNLKDNSYLLTTTLAEIMKNTKPPPPPQDYYIMNGIMLECVHCGHHSQSIMAAARHYQEKHGERYLFCYSCGVNFRSATNLYKHEKRCDAPDAAVVLRARALALGRKGRSRPYIPTTTDDKPKKFECSECSASFSSKYALRAHLLTHRGERPYCCHLCAAAYTSRTSLARHVKKHSDVEYICDHCKRSFKVKGALVEHIYTHRPEKRFGCAECPKRYAQKMALDLHVMQKHRNLPPPCACRLCPNRYRRMSILKEHMKKMHGMMIMTRKMFFKKLPTLSTPQINQGKLVFKDVVDNQNSYFITQCRKTQS